ncbi:hypothetical protein [Mucilaginibacter antarcticus]|uniref:hypothetical protein n=1 Tax=Mucilaginibacter antarcticus TaxID=1855725 RepID=UPI003638EFB9
MVGIQKVPWRFGRVKPSLFISAYGVGGNKFDIRFVKAGHRFWQRKNSQPVNAVMAIKPQEEQSRMSSRPQSIPEKRFMFIVG